MKGWLSLLALRTVLGSSDGACEGLELGPELGPFEGAALKVTLGAPDGFIVVGALDGLVVGRFEGVSEGCWWARIE